MMLIALAAAGQQTRPAPPGLAAAKALYAAASFEEALGQLSAATPTDDPDQVDTYRALCLMALGRENEAAQSLERLLDRNPFHSLTDAEVSPRLVTMFRDVRTRRLPTAARDTYMRARTKYDERSFDAAAGLLRDLLTALGREDMDGQAGLADLKLLAEGFLKLTETELARAAESSATAAAPAPTPPPPPPLPMPPPGSPPVDPADATGRPMGGSPAPVVYSPEDRHIVGPVEVTRRVPNWNPPPTVKRGVYHGLIEVVINERGVIERAEILISISPSYDPLLLDATKMWKFRPATLDGSPVKYRRRYEIILHPE
jgi:tetratricopeptide (TPR) repeat protein